MARQSRHSDVIRQLREANDEALGRTVKFLDYCEKQKSTPRETAISALQAALGVSRRDMVGLVDGIGDAGIGTRIVGRRGLKSRIRWHFSLPSIAEVARGRADELDEAGVKPGGGHPSMDTRKLRRLPNYRKIGERAQIRMFKDVVKEIRAIRTAAYGVVRACDTMMRKYGISELDLSSFEESVAE
jgi:hypothetical protein